MTMKTLFDLRSSGNATVIAVNDATVLEIIADLRAKTLYVRTTADVHYFKDIDKIEVRDGKAFATDLSGQSVEMRVDHRSPSLDRMVPWSPNGNIHIRTVQFE